MPTSLHKILVHGYAILSHFEIPIGEMAEDCLEARHKEVRKERLQHTRKSSRENSNRDLMNRLLLTSDPFLAAHRKQITKNREVTEFDDDDLIHLYLIEETDVTVVSGLTASNLESIIASEDT